MSSPATSKTQETQPIRPSRKLEGHTKWVTGVIHLSCGQRIITCSRDTSLRVWDLESGKQLGDDWRDGESEVRSIALSPDGKKIVSGSNDGGVRLWDIDTGKVITNWTGHTMPVSSLCWNRDGRKVASGSYDTTARVWDVESGETILTIETELNDVEAIIYSPDTTMIATSGAGKENIKIWDAKTGKLIANLEGHTRDATCLAWTPDGKTLISGSWDASIRTWNTTTWQQIVVLRGHGEGHVNGIALSPNGRILASAANDSTVRLWHLENGQPIGLPLKNSNAVACTSFSTDGKLLATGSWDKNAYTWDISAIVRDAGLDELLSNPQDGDASFLVNEDSYPLPEGFFDDPRDHLDHRHPSHGRRRVAGHTILGRFSSLFRPTQRDAQDMVFRPRLLDRARNLISITPRGHDGESIVLTERRPRAVDVSFAQGQRRNASAREVRMKREKEKNAKNAKKNHGQQLSSSISAVATATSAQQSSGAAHTQQSSQPQVLLTTTPTAAAAMSITGTPLHPDIVIRQPGLSTRLRLFLCCISAEIADDDH